MATAGTIQLPNDASNTGKLIDNSTVTVGPNTVYRQRTNITDGSDALGIATVMATPPAGTEYGLVVRHSGALPSGGNTIGTVGLTGSLPSGSNTIGNVTVNAGVPISATYNSSPPTFSNATSNPLQSDVNGKLLVAGTFNANTTGTATTAAPTYTTGTTNPFSLTLAGALRTDGSGVTQPTSITGIIPNAATYTDRSGTITTGGSSQTLMATNASRHGWEIYNSSAGDLWYNDVGGAATNGGSSIKIPTGANVNNPARSHPNGVSTAAITIWGATNAQAFASREL